MPYSETYGTHHCTYKFLHGENIIGTKELLNLSEKGMRRTSDWKLKPDKFKSEIRHSVLTLRIINYWKILHPVMF